MILGKEGRNASWLIAGRFAQMLIAFGVNILSARYLGPSNYGLISYGLAYVLFFTSLCSLGINSVIIRNFVDYPDEEGVTIGTALLLRLTSSLFSVIMIIGIVAIIDKDDFLTIVVVALCSISLIFQVFDTFNYWFQSRYQSKITSIVVFCAYGIVALYKVALLITGKSVKWFAVANALDYMLIAILLYIAYRKYNGPKLRFSIEKAKQLLNRSWHYILSGTMVAIYGQTDKLMLKHMLNDAEVGYYATAASISTCWVFILSAIIDSMYPTIMTLYNKDKNAFNKKNEQLYSIIFYMSMFVSVGFMMFGRWGILLLYGNAYAGAVAPLCIVTWYTALAYLGVARNAWIVCENKQKYLKYMYLSAVIINVGLNYLLIPLFAAAGAAIASLITQLCTCVVLPACIRDMRPNCMLMLRAINPKSLLCIAKKICA